MCPLITARRNRGFTLLEILVVVLVIGMLLAIALPGFRKARSNSASKSCIASLRHIKMAKEQFAMSAKKNAGDVVNWSDIVPDYLREKPECPLSGSYDLQPVDTNPTCSESGHVLP